jgi:hypothetical protein
VNQAAPEMPISLIRGGTLYWVQEKARLIHPGQWSLHKRLPLAIAIAWLPLVILTAMHGGSGSSSDLAAVLTDYRVYARVFIAIPLLLLGQITMETHFRDMAQHFLDANLVGVDELPRFRRIMEKARHLRDAKLPETLAIVAVYLQIAYMLQSGRLHYPSWAVEAGSNTLTPAGYYSGIAGARPLEVDHLGCRASRSFPIESSVGFYRWRPCCRTRISWRIA